MMAMFEVLHVYRKLFLKKLEDIIAWTKHPNMKLGWWVNFRNQFFLLIWVNKQGGELNTVELPQHCTLLQTISAILSGRVSEGFVL